ncbi:hypothetical protein NUACC21_55770 [Scytonema sp. NUACC21]
MNNKDTNNTDTAADNDNHYKSIQLPPLLMFMVIAVKRSLFPLSAVVIILSTIWWGPWMSFILAFTWFCVVLMWIG